MRILQVMAGAEQGGAETFFLEAVLALAEAGITQAVVTRPNDPARLKRLAERGIKTYTAPFDRLLRWRTARAIETAFAEFKPDLAQYWMGRAGSFARPRHVTQIGWYGGYYKPERFRHCDFHLAITDDILRHLTTSGVPPERTGLVHVLVDPAVAPPIARASLGTPADAPLLLALARLHWKKGLDVLLDAMPAVEGAYLWIAGEGPLRRALERQAKALGLRNRVRFLGWRNDRAALLATADICVFPSRYEPFGAVILDAWSAGVPLVAAAAQGPSAVVQDGVNGLLVPVDDPAALARAVNRLIESADLRKALAAAGQRTYDTHFSKAAFIESSIALYGRLLKRIP